MKRFLEIVLCGAESLLLIKSAGSHFSLSLAMMQNHTLPSELITLVYSAKGHDINDSEKR